MEASNASITVTPEESIPVVPANNKSLVPAKLDTETVLPIFPNELR